jgi:ABC-2 type transport system permease protein
MNKILLIISREFLSRVRKKSFFVMAILGPFLFALIMIVPLSLGTSSQESKVVEVLDNSGYLQYKLQPSKNISFAYFNESIELRKIYFLDTGHDALLHIPKIDLSNPKGIVIYSKTTISPEIKLYVERVLNQAITSERLRRSGIDESILKNIESNITISSKNLLNEWEEVKDATASAVVALFSSILIMFFIILYGGQVMRGVIEEKTNRIIEVIVSSVKPFQLMLGKIIGIALVSLSQFLIWISLTLAIGFYVNTKYSEVFELYSDENIETTLKENPDLNAKKAAEVNQVVNAVKSINFSLVLGFFLFYFLGGYLLYSALFAAIGSLVDSETDTQQFIIPLIAPLMFCMVMATSIVLEPHGNLAFWLSMIPFTSPVAMMLRISFDVPLSELLLSIFILIISFLFMTWIAGRVYRVGILMYGKSVSVRELVRWMFY